MKLPFTNKQNNSPGPLFDWANTHPVYCPSWQHNRLAREWGVPLSVARVIATANGLGPRGAI
jgi:hypothetical protein